jgi:hypothetical protein
MLRVFSEFHNWAVLVVSITLININILLVLISIFLFKKFYLIFPFIYCNADCPSGGENLGSEILQLLYNQTRSATTNVQQRKQTLRIKGNI